MAIVNVRGTSGSGKSTLIQAVMAKYAHREPIFIEGRKRPIGYNLHRADTRDDRPLWVMGHYEIPTGGCDTISYGYDWIYAHLRNKIAEGYDLLYEGLVMQNDVRRCIELGKEFPGQLTVILLNTHIDECVASVQRRRDERGNDKPFDPANTKQSYRSTLNQKSRFRDAGIDFRHLSREDALRDTLSIFGL